VRSASPLPPSTWNFSGCMCVRVRVLVFVSDVFVWAERACDHGVPLEKSGSTQLVAGLTKTCHACTHC
jgi:hypothetical protein